MNKGEVLYVDSSLDRIVVPSTAHMELAVQEAYRSRQRGEAAVGAVVARGEQVLGFGGNMVHTLGDRRKHAEVVACDMALATLADLGQPPDLDGAVLYSTHEPCPGCAGDVVNLRLGGLVFGTNQATIREIKEADPTFKWRNSNIRAEFVVKDGPDPDMPIVDGFAFDECLAALGDQAVAAFRRYRAANPLA